MQAHEIGHWRLANQHVTGNVFASPKDVVAHMGAMQAQDYMQSVWAIGLRTQSPLLADVERAIENGDILRTWPMRGTIHFVAPQHARWMLRLCGARMLAADQSRLDNLDLTVATIMRCGDLLTDALSGGRRLSRPDIMALLENAGISTAGQRTYHILWYLSQLGLLCLGPMQGKQQTFVLLDEWAPNALDLSPEESLAALARMYFTSHGPATVQDLGWWAGISMTEAKAALELVRNAFVSETIDRKTYWMPESLAASARPQAAGHVLLLPGFDEFLLGYKDRGAVLAAEYAQRIVPGNNGVFQSMIVIDGQVVGTWRRSIGKKHVEITLIPFQPLGALEDAAAEAAGAYARFVALPLKLTIER
ncbi:MAG: winged helix DNA-binding domain-containing protein [Pleurocapsa minor GSE-CHR-MK-17-07R]|jgi:hypothetical protein|nr:winged helix DNA-binding domain-containing protein [Pleurocapsa minor GSE-CHR-MK 17-07R]